MYPISQRFYQAVNLLPSDHKPVCALFDVRYRDRIEKEEIRVFKDVMKTLETWKNSSIPTIQCSAQLIDIGLVKYDIPKSLTITIVNSGQSIAYWRFVNKVEESQESKRWISIDVKQGLLLSTESAKVTITVRIDIIIAQGLSSGVEILEDVLVLRLENGRDIYLPVSAEYERSCFGMSLEALVNTKQPVRNIPLAASVRRTELLQDNGLAIELLHSEKLILTDPNKSLYIPKELWRLVDALYAGNAMKEKDLFAMSGIEEELYIIREALDFGEEFTVSCSPHSYAPVLQDFIQGIYILKNIINNKV